MADRQSTYEHVTQQILAELDNCGVPPWRKPWACIGGGMPANVVSGNSYRGVNVLLLWGQAQAKGYDSNQWGTYRQWQGLGGHVHRGERATKIIYWNVTTELVADKATGEDREEKRFFCRQYSVFNLGQCGGEALDRFRIKQPTREFNDFEPAEEAITATDADIRHGGNQALYSPLGDYIQMPNKEAFQTEASYYSTCLHELVHWSGSESRLNRLDKLARFGSASYAAEELVAELGAAFLTATLGIPNAPIQDNSAYLNHWLSVLKSDSRAIFTASTAASAAADYIESFSKGVESDELEAVAV